MGARIPQPRIRILELFFLLLLMALTYGFYRVMEPFLLNLFLALIFTSVLFPSYEKLRKRLGNRAGLASLVVVFLVFVVVAIPATVIALLVYSEAVSGYAAVAEQTARARGVGVTQNLIKPKLLGDRSGLNPALALLATIGRIMWLGLIGFLVGPLPASLFIVVWQRFGKRYQAELRMKDTEIEPPDGL